MHLSGLYIYPVKSLRGCAVKINDVDGLGLAGDRRFLVVDAADNFLTQRVLPRMALIRTDFAGSSLTLSTERSGSIAVPRRVAPGAAKMRTVTVWKSEDLQAEDCGDSVAQWLSDFLAVPCRLVRIGEQFHRPVLKPTARPGDLVAFNDAYPFMAISEASLADLNRRLEEAGQAALPMNRFRPNLVIADCAPYAEDSWPRIRIGDLVLRAGGACARCVVTTTDQFTAERGKEPLHLLATYRRDSEDPTRLNFGHNFIHETKTGTLRLGDTVEVLGT